MNPRLRGAQGQHSKDNAQGQETNTSNVVDKKRRSVSKSKGHARKFLKVLSIILGGIIIAWILFIACTRWILVSDATDIQGTWSIAGSEKEVPITDTQITLSDDVTYNYTLDETSKTIEISLGTMSGKSHYVFSLNRQQIVIFDGDYDAFYSTMIDVQDFFTSLFSGNISAQSAGYKTSGSEKTIIRLNRVA